MINSSYYIKGKCSSEVVNNVCKGVFVGKKVVSCPGNPLVNPEDFKACKRIQGETFGNCTGTTSSAGCVGIYTQFVKTPKGEVLTLRTLKQVHYDTVTLKGSCRLKYIQKTDSTILKHNIFCYKEFNPRTLSCDKGIYKIVDLMPNGVLPGLYRTDAYVCDKSNIQFSGKFSCESQEYKKYSCLGKSHFLHKKGVIKEYTCLGTMKTLICPNGGSHDDCSDGQGKRTECISSFFDGENCLKDKGPENTEIKIVDLGRDTIKDADGLDVIIHKFKVKKFTMFGAFSDASAISDSALDTLNFNRGVRNPTDGSFSGLDMPETATPLKVDEGKLNLMSFYNFQLDELPYFQFCNDDEAQIIKVTFEEMLIKQLFFEKLRLRNIIVEKLIVSGTTYPFYGIDREEIKLGYGEMNLRDVTLYLPYIPKKAIEAWRNGQESFIEVNIPVPRVDSIRIPTYKIKFDRHNTLFLEFPHLSIENKSLDLLTLEDFYMKNERFTTNPTAAEALKKSYLEWIAQEQNNKNN